MELMKRVLIRTLPVLIFTIMSCSKDMNVSSADIVTLIDNELYVSRADTVIKSADAVKVANLFSFNGTDATKVNFSKSVKSVNEFKDSESELGVYVVNYEGGGWVLVSSTKKHYPILAYSDKGIFCTDTLNGVSQYLNSYKREINRKHKLPVSDVKSEMEAWKVYEEKNMPGYYMTKDSDPLTGLIGRSMSQWSNEGYDVYPITEDEIEGIPNNVLTDFKLIAETSSNYNYDYQISCFILKGYYSVISGSQSYLLQTAWGQQNGYNQYLVEEMGGNPYIGCGAVAIGQIMKYHSNYPLDQNRYKWGNMSNVASTEYTAQLLYDINRAIRLNDVNYNATSIEKIANYLNTICYSYDNLYNNNSNSIFNSIYNNRPVYMQGGLYNSLQGHAWVCDGAYRVQNFKVYRLMILSYDEPLSFVQAGEYGPLLLSSDYYFHMNWGEYGVNNGWYTSGQSMQGFDYGRMNIYDICPM